jgi:replicative DNA helicase Mcm
VDKQIARVSDLPEGKEQSESALVHLYGDHIGTVSSGDTLVISGVVKHVEVSPNQNETKTEREIVVTHIENQDAQEIELSDDDIEWIESLENPVEVLLESIAPHLVGIDDKKRGTLHTLVSGHEMVFEDLRTKSHILHIGDPSTGKSDLISWFNNILPNSIYAAAESATGVGLTATVEREERLGGKWVCHAGTLVKANEGHAFVDELGEFSEDDQNKLRTALSKGEVIMNKASIQDRHLPASSRLVGSANPIDGEFNRFDPPADQFDMPSPILSRMDLVYIWTTEDQDTEAVAHAVANKYITTDDSTQDPPLAPEEVGKYIYYVMNEYQPDITPEVANAVATVWQQLNDETDGNVDTRDEDAIMRLAISSARLHRRDTVTIEDVEAAKEMKVDSLRQMGNGEIDAQVKYTGELTEQSAARKAVLSTVETAELIEDEELVAELEDYPETTVRHFIEKHLNEGRITRVSGGDLAMNA